MKKLTVQQRWNSDYVSPDHTPSVDKHTYCVSKLINAINPPINTLITAAELQGYCDDENWLVTVT